MKLTITLLIALSFMIGCGSRGASSKIIEKKPQIHIQTKQQTKTYAVPKRTLPKAPKKRHIPKAVEDNNYSDKYMYPEDSKAAKKDPVKEESTRTTSPSMTKEECVSMISQEKFDRYTAMFGTEAASIKRCAMIKAMKK